MFGRVSHIIPIQCGWLWHESEFKCDCPTQRRRGRPEEMQNLRRVALVQRVPPLLKVGARLQNSTTAKSGLPYRSNVSMSVMPYECHALIGLLREDNRLQPAVGYDARHGFFSPFIAAVNDEDRAANGFRC